MLKQVQHDNRVEINYYKTKMSNLDFLFNPNSIAIVGVSQDPTKLGSVLLSNLVEAGFKGKIYPVNPKYENLFGYKTYAKVSDIPEELDLVCIVIPPQFVKDALIDAGEKKVKGVVIITAGFKEIGAEGQQMEKELKEIAAKYNIRVLGPNCLGAIIPKSGINISFAASQPFQGDIAFFSQSGAFCTAILDMSLEKNVGFSHLVSYGNKLDINENDFIENWLADESVKVIGGYIEEISDGYKLVEIYRNSRNKKPLILIKAGASDEAQKAISSHTGSIAGSMQTFKTAMNQSGIIVADEVNQMFNLMMSFSWSKLPKGNRIGVVTNAGGPGIIATDSLVNHGLKIAEISEESKTQIKSALPPTASVHNPIDVIGDALAERYRIPIDVLVKDENVDAILVILTPQLVTQIEETAKLIINSSKLSDKPIIPVFLGGKYVSQGLQRFYDEKVPAFRYIDDAVEAISVMYEYYNYMTKANPIDKSLLENVQKGEYHQEIIQKVNANLQNLEDDIAFKIAAEVGLDLPKQFLCSNIEEAIDFAKDIYPVVAKVPSEIISHKTEEKALYLDIKNEVELSEAFMKLVELEKKYEARSLKSEASSLLPASSFPARSEHLDIYRSEAGGRLPKILIQEQIKADEEIFIGAKRDGNSQVYDETNPGFGHLLVFGKGGIYTEIYKDLAYALVPFTKDELIEKFKQTKVYKIIDGARGKKKLAFDKLIDTIMAVQKMVLLYPEIESLDLNPILLTDSRAVVVDLKIFIKS